jgi:hypothetical protein
MSEHDSSKVERGTTSPKYTLEESLGFLKTLDASYGGRAMSRDAIAEALGHSASSSAVAVKIGSLTHYGLLRRTGNVYEPSQIAQDLLIPTSDTAFRDARAKAAKSPALYRRLFADLSGKAIPQRFSAILQRDYSVARGNANDVAKTFIATAEFSGLLMHGVLHQEPVEHIEHGDAAEATRSSTDTSNLSNPKPTSRSETESTTISMASSPSGTTYTIPLSRGRTAGLTLPRPIAAKDLQRLTQWIDLMSDVLMEGGEEDKITIDENSETIA